MASKYKLPKVTICGKDYEIGHEFTNQEIEELLVMEEIGSPISFKDAYEIRFMENFKAQSLANTRVVRTKMLDFLVQRGMYLKFDESLSSVIYQ